MNYYINWDEEFPKHCVRYYGWFPAAKSYKKLLGDKDIKYFTLCAGEALDIFTFERGGILSRDKQRKLPNVVICERNRRLAGQIYRLVRPPLKEAIIWNDIRSLLLFSEERVREKKAEIESMPGEISAEKSSEYRGLLRAKDQLERLKRIFPFDIVNFDPCGSMLDTSFGENDLYKSFAKFFEYQLEATSFLLFLTTEFYGINEDNDPIFGTAFNDNVTQHNEIREALQTFCEADSYETIKEERKKNYLGFLKAAILPAALDLGWHAKHQGVFVYENSHRNPMMSSIIEFYRENEVRQSEESIDDILNVIKKWPSFISWDEGENDKKARADLEAVKKYREAVRNEFRTS